MESSAEAQPTDGAEIGVEWLRGLAAWLANRPPDQWEGDRYRFFDTIKKLLLSDQPESQYFRFLIVNELEERRRRDTNRGGSRGRRRPPNAYKNNVLARLKDIELQKVIADKRRLGVNSPVKDAETEVAKRWGHLSGSALNQWLRRNRLKTEQTEN